MSDISQRLIQVRERITQALIAAQRPLNTVSLVAVSKTQSISNIQEAYNGQQRSFGENYPQEAQLKILALSDLSLDWHFIGRVQSNKTALIARCFGWVHTIDRLDIAQRLSQQRPKDLPPIQCCIQVNLSQETTKGGVYPKEVIHLAKALINLPGIRLRGLMTIPAPTNEVKEQRAIFAKLRHLLEGLNTCGYTLDTLSMGMSNDLEAAIAEGATIVRVGTDIFGARPV